MEVKKTDELNIRRKHNRGDGQVEKGKKKKKDVSTLVRMQSHIEPPPASTPTPVKTAQVNKQSWKHSYQDSSPLHIDLYCIAVKWKSHMENWSRLSGLGHVESSIPYITCRQISLNPVSPLSPQSNHVYLEQLKMKDHQLCRGDRCAEPSNETGKVCPHPNTQSLTDQIFEA